MALSPAQLAAANSKIILNAFQKFPTLFPTVDEIVKRLGTGEEVFDEDTYIMVDAVAGDDTNSTAATEAAAEAAPIKTLDRLKELIGGMFWLGRMRVQFSNSGVHAFGAGIDEFAAGGPVGNDAEPLIFYSNTEVQILTATVTSTAVGGAHLIDTALSMTPEAHRGQYVRMLTGSRTGVVTRIHDNTSDTVKLVQAVFGTGAGDDFEIIDTDTTITYNNLNVKTPQLNILGVDMRCADTIFGSIHFHGTITGWSKATLEIQEPSSFGGNCFVEHGARLGFGIPAKGLFDNPHPGLVDSNNQTIGLYIKATTLGFAATVTTLDQISQIGGFGNVLIQTAFIAIAGAKFQASQYFGYDHTMVCSGSGAEISVRGTGFNKGLNDGSTDALAAITSARGALLDLKDMDVFNAAGSAVAGNTRGDVLMANIDGSGNALYGLDMQFGPAMGGAFQGNSVTGTLGDVKAGDTAVAAWGALPSVDYVNHGIRIGNLG